MNSINIRGLKHETGDLLKRVALGETVEIRRRNKPIALIKPYENHIADKRPDFRARLHSAYGDTVMKKTATELLQEERGNR